MGGGGVLKYCDGTSVFAALDKVFLDPSKSEYTDAQDKKHLFKLVKGDPVRLYLAYLAVGVIDPEDSLWLRYLQSLSPSDINQIASARFDGLNAGKGKKGKPFPTPQHHDPADNSQVHRSPATDPAILIDVPFNPNADCP